MEQYEQKKTRTEYKAEAWNNGAASDKIRKICVNLVYQQKHKFGDEATQPGKGEMCLLVHNVELNRNISFLTSNLRRKGLA